MKRKIETINFIKIDAQRITQTCRIYSHWKQLDAEIRTLSTRGVNFPGELSENFACYALGYLLNKGKGGDAYDPKTDKIIEMKGTGADTDDLSSFSPSEEFDELVFVKLNKKEDCIYIYETGVDSEDLKHILVNRKETVGDQQKVGKRPRFSVYKKIIEPNNIKPSVKFDIISKEITRLENE